MKKFKFNDALGIVFVLYIISMAVVMLMSFCGDNNKSELEVYKKYYEVTEKVLDELDEKYDIADELSSEYYDAVQELTK
jgi:hypothetical protein